MAFEHTKYAAKDIPTIVARMMLPTYKNKDFGVNSTDSVREKLELILQIEVFGISALTVGLIGSILADVVELKKGGVRSLNEFIK